VSPMDPIRIDLERSGGFAGVTMRASVDTGTLPPDEAREIDRLVGQVDFAGLARRPPAPPRGADRFHYDLTVRRGGERHHVSLPESAVPPELKPLLDRLVAIARRG
jgi:hypothetical protein